MDWRSLALNSDVSVIDALRGIENNAAQFALVVDNEKLQGVITDGDIRRALLRGVGLGESIAKVVKDMPVTVPPSVNGEQALNLLDEHDIAHLPSVDSEGRILWLWSRKELGGSAPLPNAVIIMAGGLGSRLGELTQECPKPMLRVGGRPILEIVLEKFCSVGFRRFYFAVNYKAEQIHEYFGDGERFQCQIEYLHESKRMGTAGALSLLPPQQHPIIVANADILTQLNARTLLFHHLTKKCVATMLVKRFSMQVPYGVVEHSSDGDVLAIREKPEFSFCVSAGMYALSPEALPLIPKETFFDMPDLFQKLLQQGKKPSVMETHNYWLDIGLPPDYERAKKEFM